VGGRKLDLGAADRRNDRPAKSADSERDRVSEPHALRAELKPLLERYAAKAPKYKRSRGLARNLLKVWPALSTFTETRRAVQQPCRTRVGFVNSTPLQIPGIEEARQGFEPNASHVNRSRIQHR
jgi:hypothetical protein